MRILLSSLIFASLSFADIKVFKYELKTFPPTSIGCHATARNVGQKVSGALGQPIRLARCLAESKDGYDIVVEYEREKPVELVSTSGGGISIDPTGQYTKQEECAAQLDSLTELFRNETRLIPIFAYCQKISSSNRYQWFARIDAFGNATKEPFIDGFYIFGAPVDCKPGQFGAELKAGIEAQGIRVTHVRTHSLLSHARVSIHYYRDKAAQFSAKEYTSSRKPEECLAQVSMAKAILSRFNTKPLIVYCGHTAIGEIELTAAYEGALDSKTTHSIEAFKTFEECLINRDALVEKYKTELQLPVEGGICNPDANGYRIVMFEHI